MLLRAQVELMLSAMELADRTGRELTKRRDQRGAIPAELAWIAGLVVLALAVIAIISLITTTKASSINLGG